MKFKIGDRVTYSKHKEFGVGTIINIRDNKFFVRFDNKHKYLHGCNGYCEYNHGYICSKKYLVPVNNNKNKGIKVKSYIKPDYIHNDVSKVILNDKTTIVFLETGEKGLSKLCPGDKFNEELGYKIAYKRATIEKLKNEIKNEEHILNLLIK